MDRRNTVQKELIYDAVMSYSGHPSAEDVYREISSRHSTISKATVYRNLSLLAEDQRLRLLVDAVVQRQLPHPAILRRQAARQSLRASAERFVTIDSGQNRLAGHSVLLHSVHPRYSVLRSCASTRITMFHILQSERDFSRFRRENIRKIPMPHRVNKASPFFQIN